MSGRRPKPAPLPAMKIAANRRFAVGDQVGAPGGAGAQQAHPRQVAELLAQLIGRGDDGVVQLLQGGTAAAHRGLARRAQHPQCLDCSAAVLGDLDALTGEGRLRRGDRIQPVVLAASATGRAVGASDLEDRDAGCRQMTSDPRPIGAGRLDAYPGEVAVRAEPGEHRTVTCPRRRERLRGEHLAGGIDHRCGVQVLVGVDAADDIAAGRWHAVHAGSLRSADRGRRRTCPTTDTTVRGRLWSGSHQVTFVGRGSAPRPAAPEWPTRPGNDTHGRSECGSGRRGQLVFPHLLASIAVRVRPPEGTGNHILTI
jgi:hypothetical protein